MEAFSKACEVAERPPVSETLSKVEMGAIASLIREMWQAEVEKSTESRQCSSNSKKLAMGAGWSSFLDDVFLVLLDGGLQLS